MACEKLRNLAIKGIVCALPENKVLSTEYYDIFGKDEVDKVMASAGIKSTYRVLPRQTASDLSFAAAENLIDKLAWERKSIGALIFLASSTDYKLPATACVLHGRLGLSRNCITFDVGLGCSGFVYGITVLGSLMQNSSIKRAMLLLGDMHGTVKGDTNDELLFGSCGVAVALEKEDGVEDIHYLLQTDGTRYQKIIVPGGGSRHRNSKKGWQMNGMDIFSFSISDVVATIKEFAKREEIDLNQVDMIALHQSNLKILRMIARKCKVNPEKCPVVIDRYGNTGASSVPLVIVDTLAREKDRQDKYRMIACGYGVGLSWGVMEFVLDGSVKTGIVYTTDYFDDGFYEEGNKITYGI